MSASNRLASEQSPYLLQHACNPVDWYPWGPEAFAKARAENKPIFLSIGYSTCHWCHVMEHESFENQTTADYLNAHFVSIKVDREERPDIDRIYMSFVQSTTGSGGWPMSVWLTPDLKPFVGGTYFPPADRHGRAGFPTLLERIAEAWKSNLEGVINQSERMTESLRAATVPTTIIEPDIEPLRKLFDYATTVFDAEWAGFGDAPKFPRPAMLNILLRISRNPNFSNADQTSALRMVRETLRAMSRGGMHDHLGGGFHRYSVDRFWHVPHFEKMLYDQAQIAIACLENWQRSSGGENGSRNTAISTLDYVLGNLRSPDGGFYSAEDADSLPAVGDSRKIEGAFYVWQQSDLENLLGDDASLFCRAYDVHANGNAPDGSDPHGELNGENVLYQKVGLTALVRTTHLPKPEIEARLGKARRTLLEHRKQRPRPHRDEKILTSWNGLMISAFARCGAAFGESRYLEAAIAAADFLITEIVTPDGKLARSFCQTSSGIPAFADDYAFFIQGLLDLYESTLDSRWLKKARELQNEQNEFFYDKENGGYFSTRMGEQDLIVRLKDDYDGAEPSANAIAANNLLRLAAQKGDPSIHAQASQTLRSLSPVVNRMPQAVPQVLVAVERMLTAPRQIVLAGDRGSREMKAFLREIARRFLPDVVVMAAADCDLSMPALDGKPTAYLCENFTCQLPVTAPSELARLLDSYTIC